MLTYEAIHSIENQQDEAILFLEKEFGPEPNSYHKMNCHASPTKSDWVCILGNTFITSVFIYFFTFLATPCSMWDLSSPTRE